MAFRKDFTMKERAISLGDRVRESELFPRIRDAEREMYINDDNFLKRMEKKKKKRELRKHCTNNKPLFPRIKKDDLFACHVLNKDPKCSGYMPFDKVFFPKLFSNSIDVSNPHSIDSYWTLGAQHEDFINK